MELIPFITESMNGFGYLNPMAYDNEYLKQVDELSRLIECLQNQIFLDAFIINKKVHISIGCGNNYEQQIPSFINYDDEQITIILIDGDLKINYEYMCSDYDVDDIVDIPNAYLLDDRIILLGFKTYMPCKFDMTQQFNGANFVRHYIPNKTHQNETYTPKPGYIIQYQNESSVQYVDNFYETLYEAIEVSFECNVYNFAVILGGRLIHWGNNFEFYPQIKDVFIKSTKMKLYTWVHPNMRFDNLLLEALRKDIKSQFSSIKKCHVMLSMCSSIDQFEKNIEKYQKIYGKFIYYKN